MDTIMDNITDEEMAAGWDELMQQSDEQDRVLETEIVSVRASTNKRKAASHRC